MRQIVFGLIIALFLGACSGISKAPRPPQPPDDSHPTISSVSQYLGGLVSFDEDLFLAENMLHRAQQHDPGSPQIKRELFKARMELNRRGQGYPAGDLLNFLQAGKSDRILAAQDLAISLQIFENLEYEKGIDWVLAELAGDYRDDLGLFTLYVFGLSRGAAVNKATVKEIIAKSDKKESFSIALANVHLKSDPQLSLSLIKNYPKNPNSEALKLEIYAQNRDLDSLRKMYKSYRYPEDKQNIINFIRQMQAKALPEIVLENYGEILKTEDKSIIRFLADFAFFGDQDEIMRQIGEYLINSLPELKEDTQIAPVLIANALHTEESTLPTSDFCRRLAGVKYAFDIVQLYLYKNMAEFQADQDAAKLNLARKIQLQIPEAPLKELLLALSEQEEENQMDAAVLGYCEYLIAEKRAGREEYSTVIQNLEFTRDEEKMLTVLRQAALDFPRDDFFLNNLGYTLLKSGHELAEAERLIKRAQSLNPTAPHIADSMAWLHYKKGDFRRAQSWIDESIRLSAEQQIHSEIWYHKGMIHLALDEHEAAKEALGKIGDASDEYYQKLEAAIRGVR